MYHYPYRFKRLSAQFTGALVMLYLCACDKSEPASYRIPKEERTFTMPAGSDSKGSQGGAIPATQQSSGGMRLLPGMQEAADAAPDLKFSVPDGWKDLGSTAMRKANLLIPHPSGKIEVTALTFPGDVGGLEANINRWAEQAGLKTFAPDALKTIAMPYVISGHSGHYVKLAGAEQSIIGGILPFHGNTWFFKMKGPSEATLSQEKNFKSFLDSVSIEDRHH